MAMVQLQGVFLSLLVCLELPVYYFANAQLPGLECPPFTVDILGSTTNLSTEGLLANSIQPGGEVPMAIPVRVVNYKIVCDASGRMRDTSSYISVLVSFQCDSSSQSDCDGTTVLTRQYQYYCTPSTNEYGIFDSNFVQTFQPNATFQTQLDNNCIRCVDDVSNPSSDPVTHCDSCSARCASKGLGRCYFGLSVGDPEVCCSYYNDSMCVDECLPPLVANDVTFDCECGLLNSLENGAITYGNNLAIGSVAIHTCNSGYRIEGGTSRTCTFGGWDGQNITCVFVECANDLTIENGIVSYPDINSVGAVATYTCNDDYFLMGDRERVCQLNATWSGSPPTCEKCSLMENDPNCESCIIDANGNEVCVCKEGTVLDTNGRCVDKGFVQCPELTSTIENGEVAIIPDNRPVNSKATYMCDSNYELEGIGARYCQLDGTWNGTAPKCNKKSDTIGTGAIVGIIIGIIALAIFILTIIVVVVSYLVYRSDKPTLPVDQELETKQDLDNKQEIKP